jgi:hypothetical protein
MPICALPQEGQHVAEELTVTIDEGPACETGGEEAQATLRGKKHLGAVPGNLYMMLKPECVLCGVSSGWQVRGELEFGLCLLSQHHGSFIWQNFWKYHPPTAVTKY